MSSSQVRNARFERSDQRSDPFDRTCGRVSRIAKEFPQSHPNDVGVAAL